MIGGKPLRERVHVGHLQGGATVPTAEYERGVSSLSKMKQAWVKCLGAPNGTLQPGQGRRSRV